MTITRRRFLTCAAGSLACAPSVFAAQPNKTTAVHPFAFSLYGMRTLDLDTALTTCAKIGYDAVELALMPGYHAEPKRLANDARRRLRDRLRTLRLGLSALMVNLPLHGNEQSHRDQLPRLQAALALGRELAPDAAPVIETILGGGVNDWEKLRRQFVNRLGDWARLAEKHKTIIAVKPHRGNAMNLPGHALWLMEQVKSPWIKLAYDYSHFQHRNLSIADTVKSLMPHTRFVHIKDTRLVNGRAQFTLPGDGGIDYAQLLRAIRTAGYHGCICVEVSGQVSGQKGYDPSAAARRCYANVAPVFIKAELRRR
ncbi:MAG: sugar phosphate isomerase/epimerase [Planctomycetes bacterium]|nr:sugar phosphate isomerase/epimerase [Planctomycetota bacterium]